MLPCGAALPYAEDELQGRLIRSGRPISLSHGIIRALGLLPIRRPTRAIGLIAPLRNDPLKAKTTCCAEQSRAIRTVRDFAHQHVSV